MAAALGSPWWWWVVAGAGVALLVIGTWAWRERRRRQVAEGALRRLRHECASLRRALDEQALVAVTDCNGVIQEVNERFCAISGYRREELVGHTHRMMKSPRHPPEFYRELWRTVSAGHVWRGEICNLTKDGREFILETTIVPTPGPDGRPAQYLALRHDVTLPQQVAAERELLALVAQRTTAAVVITDAAGRVEWVNAAYEKLTGYERAALVGRTLGALLHGAESDPQTIAEMREHGSAGRGFEVELLNYRRDGTTYWVQIKADPVCGPDGRVQRYVAVETDVTARRRIESLYAGIVESAAYVLIGCNAQGTIEVFNRGAERLLGYRADEMVGHATPLLWHEPEEVVARAAALSAELGRAVAPGVEALVAKAAATGLVDEGDWTFRRRDGSRLPVRLAITAMRDRHGRVTGFMGIAYDLTERQEAIERLRHSEERWQLAIAGSNDGAWEWDLAADRMWVSARNREILGLADRDEFMPRARWVAAIHPEDVDGMRAAVRQHFAGQVPVYEHTYRMRHSDGEWRWVLARGKAMFDAAGRPLRMLGTHTDVTDGHRLQELLRESEARLLEAQAVAHIGNWSLDAATRTIEWSQEAARIFGVAFRRARMAVVLRLCPAQPRSALRAALGWALARGDHAQFDTPMPGPGRHPVWVRVTVRAETAAGRTIRVYGTVQDVSALHEAQARQRESAQRLEKIAAQVPGVVFQMVRRPDGALAMPYASPGVTEFWGLPPEQLARDAAPALAATHPDDRALVRASIEESAEKLVAWICEFRLSLPGASVRWVLGNAVPERLADGGTLWHGFITDITARKQVEARLREHEVFLKELYSGIDLPLWVVDVDQAGNFRYVGVNPSFERVVGLAGDQIVGHGPCDLAPRIPLEIGRQIEDHHRDCLLAGTSINYEEHMALNGRERWWLTQLKPVQDETGRIGRVIGSAIEITERMQMEHRLRESEERFFLIARATSDAVWDYDPASGALWWSDGVTRLFGYERPGAAAGVEWWYSRIEAEDRAAVVAAFESALASAAERWECEYRFRHADGRLLYVASRALILRGSGLRAIRVVGGMTDITEPRLVHDEMSRAREAAEAANRRLQESVQRANRLAHEAAAATVAKSEFLANMSHEIRTPLNAIIGMGGLMLDTELSAQQREFAETIRVSGDALLALISDVLDFSKIESGNLELEAAPFALAECVEAALEVLGPRAGEKDLDLLYWIDPAVPARLVGDVTRLRQVLVNLVGNAVKFTARGEVQVGVARPVEAADGRLRLRCTVRDTGMGIPGERMDRLFKSFSQVDASTTRKFGGTGLGLAICRRLVELMGGRIWAESEVGRGSQFHFEVVLPPADPAGDPAAGAASPVLAERPVLVVEDNAAARDLLARRCVGWGLRPQAFATADSALAWLRGGAVVHLAIIDQQLAGVEAPALVRELRTSPGCGELPVLLYSNLKVFGRFPAELPRVVQLPKPVKPAALREAVVQLLGPAPAAAAAPAPSASARRLAEEFPLRILLAEDNPTNQRVAQLILGRFGYRAAVANNGLEALRAVETEDFDIVLLDVQMPEMDGLAAAREIGLCVPETRRPQLIAMTANAMVGDRDACLAAGMQDYVSKPVQPAELEAALRRAIARRRSGAAA